MQIRVQRLVWLVGILAAGALPPAAMGQFNPVRPPPSPTFDFVRLRTGVLMPDGGSVNAGGLTHMSQLRHSAGAPGLGRNVGYGREAVRGRVGVSVRIIILEEEEYRQTGYRRP